MTQEEKARAYDKAIERAKKELGTCGSHDCDAARQIFRFFPEIRPELKDEEVRQAMINFFKSERIKDGIAVLHFGVNIEKMLAWLEKQAPKPMWTEEDKNKIEDIIYFLNTAKAHYASTEAIDDCVDWLESLKQRIRWKPNKEQIKALHDLNLVGNISYVGQAQLLIELYNDLKKLIV